MGIPPPSPLARVTRSGVIATGAIDGCWCANQVPVRPIPVCTSSSHSKAPACVVISRAAARNPSGAAITPASPWIGSMMTAAVSSVTAAASASTSPYGTNVTWPGSGSKGSR